jgi:hypothetical protein
MMPDLHFAIIGANIAAYAAQPTLTFHVQISHSSEEESACIHSIALRSQIRLAVTRRTYSVAERQHLREIFGEPQRWGQTLHDLLWTHINLNVPAFEKSIVIDLPVPCTYDLEVVSARYFAALADGEIPLTFLFSGTVFYSEQSSSLQAGQISWQSEATYQLAVALWQDMIQHYYPGTAWLRLDKELISRLCQYKASQGLTTWDAVVEQLLQLAIGR